MEMLKNFGNQSAIPEVKRDVAPAFWLQSSQEQFLSPPQYLL